MTAYLPTRLKPIIPWRGGRLAGSDVVTLDDAARFASRHAGREITPADFLRAAANGGIPMRAICHRSATMFPARPTDNPMMIPAGSIPTLPMDACKALRNTGRASWRTIDDWEPMPVLSTVLGRYTRWQLPDGEPDIETSLDDCRLFGWDVHALADAFAKESP